MDIFGYMYGRACAILHNKYSNGHICYPILYSSWRFQFDMKYENTKINENLNINPLLMRLDQDFQDA